MTRSLVAGGPRVDDLAGKVRAVQAAGIDTRVAHAMIEPA
jgi:hypothetical protein